MNLYLNDWSYACDGELMDRWDVIGRFLDLINELKKFGVNKIVCPKGYKSIPLGGFCLKDFYTNIDGVSDDRRWEMISLMDSSLIEAKDDDLNPNVVFSLTPEFDVESLHLGNSSQMDLPVVSMAFHSNFEKELISGFVQVGEKRPSQVDIRNLFDKANNLPVVLPALKRECKYRKAEKEPMWNQKMITAYMKNIGHTDSRHSKDAYEKQDYLIRTGTMIALINGWGFHSKLSAKNTTASKKRVIFYSENFRHTDTYLCIDLEHEDMRFELCDSDGCHLGEIKYTGEITNSEPDSSHNIKI